MTAPLHQKSTYRLKVLIADDSAETRRGTRLMLAMHPGVEVIGIAQNGRQAVELGRELQPELVIMDINMPGMNGLEAMCAIRQELPESEFIVISAEREADFFKEAIRCGASEYLVKPFTYEDLEAAVRRCARNWFTRRQRQANPSLPADPDRAALKTLAQMYAKARRSDDAALDVYERLAADPQCELRWLVTLAMVYVVRQQWSQLKALAIRLEQRSAR